MVESSDEALTASRALPRYAGGQLSESSVDDPEDDEEDSTSQDDANLDADLEGFLVEGEEDEDTKKVVDRHREEVRERAQGLRFFLKARCPRRPSRTGVAHHHSQSYLQYIVHVILCPEVDWLEDEAFKTAYEAVTKERKGLLSSLIGSSAWKVKFKAAIDAYPRFGLENLFGFDRGAPCGMSSPLSSVRRLLMRCVRRRLLYGRSPGFDSARRASGASSPSPFSLFVNKPMRRTGRQVRREDF